MAWFNKRASAEASAGRPMMDSPAVSWQEQLRLNEAERLAAVGEATPEVDVPEHFWRCLGGAPERDDEEAAAWAQFGSGLATALRDTFSAEESEVSFRLETHPSVFATLSAADPDTSYLLGDRPIVVLAMAVAAEDYERLARTLIGDAIDEDPPVFNTTEMHLNAAVAQMCACLCAVGGKYRALRVDGGVGAPMAAADTAVRVAPLAGPASPRHSGRAPDPEPPPRLIRSAREAELVAAEWMRWFGFGDAQVTPIGRDGGVDVVSTRAVAQVKMEAVPTSRPVIQALFGVAQAESKTGIVFSLAGFTREAQDFADRVGVALFAFDFQGRPEANNVLAAMLRS